MPFLFAVVKSEKSPLRFPLKTREFSTPPFSSRRRFTILDCPYWAIFGVLHCTGQGFLIWQKVSIHTSKKNVVCLAELLCNCSGPIIDLVSAVAGFGVINRY
ncbi:MAG: hypothetical protein LBE18_01210 [Planctomycetaceae bacterium]|nr:hypothetical protein [Planctomycetaceae bacterium]